MSWIRNISRRCHLLPIYCIWRSTAFHVDRFIVESQNGLINYYPAIECLEQSGRNLTEKVLSHPGYVDEYFRRSMDLANAIRQQSQALRDFLPYGADTSALHGHIRRVFDLLCECAATITHASGHGFLPTGRSLRHGRRALSETD